MKKLLIKIMFAAMVFGVGFVSIPKDDVQAEEVNLVVDDESVSTYSISSDPGGGIRP
jgi:hypothetical protein